MRFDFRDQGRQLISDPQLWEEVDFCQEVAYSIKISSTDAGSPATAGTTDKVPRQRKKRVSFTVDPARVDANQAVFYQQFMGNRAIPTTEAGPLSVRCAQSLSGLALWPMIVVADDESESDAYTIAARSFPTVSVSTIVFAVWLGMINK